MALPKIVIHAPGADFTPPGKRKARIIAVRRGSRYASAKGARVLRWYVAGRIFRDLPLEPASVALTREWLAAETPERKEAT